MDIRILRSYIIETFCAKTMKPDFRRTAFLNHAKSQGIQD